MKNFISRHKTILLIFLFLTLLFINKNVFATTVGNNNWEGVPSYSLIPSLKLSTTTDSYVTLINNSRSEVVVLEPYNSNDYIVLYTSDTASNGTYNRFSGYSTNSNSLSNLKVYVSTFNTDNASWSSWSSTISSSVSAYAPGNSNYIYKSQSNVALYASGLGIVGNDVISTGIPLPDGFTFKDNISIITKGSSNIYLLYSSNLDNYLWNNNTYYNFLTPSGSYTTFRYYKYNSSTNTFDYVNNGEELHLLVNATSIYNYSYNDLASRF